MNMLAQFNEVMAYIEKSLMCDIELNQISRIAGCSEYHFRRMFSFIAGMPLGEYIRRRRLSVAGMLLQTESVKVVDLALQLGYESPEAFSKAFQAMHGITPSQAKKENVELKVLSPMTFQLTIRGGMEMNYRIVEKDDFYIVGFKKRITMQFKGINPQMDSLVQKLTSQIITELKGLCDVEPKGMLSVSSNFHERTTEGSELDQYIGVATSKMVSKDYDILHVAASTWAVFKVIGTFPDAIQDTWAKIYAEWFPTSGYELTGGPELLWNETPDTSKPDYKSEIWIPVRKIDG
ncbi:transcriptional regulator, AraC family [Desulfofarcimen acetoxidans DSM 771]|uniref:Transcriptional regulator, AraC family n=1 Tax=Desulfofarcimen acetoxidans (strain ATCC 49208 / DSM 771 / KCTC 5769 / VKM B-1644 / 5575) TaxID=485916 RepID=C8VY81_DESAS|nr:AraC family transcriptional regulator [Desulfofarcimen acetoxidans]ACV62762.1 transcriptional regulator, AraC family [Desulfofarcimen acetoxidans DSM 771]